MGFFDFLKFGSREPEAAPEAQSAAPMREAAGVTVDDDEDQWRRLGGDASRDLSPMTQSRMREIAAYLWERNLLANRMVELPVAYLLAEGVTLKAEDEASQEALDEFWHDPINDMDLKLPKKVRELALYGEQCWPAFTNTVSGAVRVGYLDPALIATVVTDPDNPEQPIGIVTVKDKKGAARRFRVIVNGPEEVFTARTQEIRAGFSDGEAFFFRINDLSSGKRGRSDLAAPADWADAYDEYLFGELERADHLRSFVWDVTLTGADKEMCEMRAKEITSPSPGALRVHNENEAWDAVTPDLKAEDGSITARLLRNHVLGGATIPEHWFGGGGDVNRAVGAEMGEPTFKTLSMRQRTWKHILEAVGRYVLRKQHGEGLKWNDPKLKVEAVFPELTARDTTKWAAALQQCVAAVSLAVKDGHLRQETAVALIAVVATRLGVEIDPAKELDDATREADKRREDDAFTGPDPADVTDNPEANAPRAQAQNDAARGAANAAAQA